MAAILLVEDDATIGDLVRSALEAQSHAVTWVRDGAGAERHAASSPVDLVLLDLSLPDRDGLRVCRTLRTSRPESVIIMLTARREEMDVVVGLETGADDYVTKPFGMSELLARIRAHLRRVAQEPPQQTRFACDDLAVDFAVRRCYVRGREVRLRAKEFDLLARLAASPGEALSRETLMYDVWDPKWFGSTKTLDVHVAALRKRLQEAAAQTGEDVRLPVITTLRGYGYRLEAPRRPRAPGLRRSPWG